MNLLFISSNRLGDAIINIQVLNKFIRENPDIKVTLVSGGLPMPLYEDFSGISSRITLVKENFSTHWINLYFKLKNHKFDHVIDFRSSIISYFLNTKSKKIFKMKKMKIFMSKFIKHLRLIYIKIILFQLMKKDLNLLKIKIMPV